MMNHHRTSRFASGIAVTLTLILGASIVHAGYSDRWTGSVKKAVERAICKRNGFTADNSEIKFHRLRIPDRYDRATDFRIEVPDYNDAVGPVTVRAVFTTKGKRLGSVPIPVRVSVYDDVLVTTRRLERHETITPSVIKRQRLDVTKIVSWAMSDPDSVVGKRATRTINPGQIVDRRWLADVPLIERGNHVLMTYSVGAVQVTSSVIAMEDGYADERIMVKSEHAKRLLPAIVKDKNTVEPAP
jgi:flagella basal body P-ring formation protein FlgA